MDSDGRIKIADLGVSAELRASGELLSGPAGTPAFAAPETTMPDAHYSGTVKYLLISLFLYIFYCIYEKTRDKNERRKIKKEKATTSILFYSLYI